MKSLSWQRVDLVRVAAKPDGLWQLAVDYVCGANILRLRVVAEDNTGRSFPTTWHLSTSIKTTADGIDTSSKTGLLTSTAPRGALIAKIGGSTADVPDPSNIASPYGSKRVFAVGSHCIWSLGANEGGPLFLTMNDSPDGFLEHDGALHVLIEECPA